MRDPIILLADDDEDDRSLFERAVTEINSSAVCNLAENGEEALIALESNGTAKPDIIFLDVNMPVMDGWDCLKRIRENDQFRDVPLIIYSTTSQLHHVVKAIKLGALCLITKPDSFKRIKEILTEALVPYETDLLERLKKFPEVKWKT